LVTIALEIVADEFKIVAVGDVADALGEDGSSVSTFSRPTGPAASDFGNAGQFIDEVTRRQPAHRKGEFRSQRQPVQHHAEREPDHGSGDRPAKDDDDGMFA